MRIARLDAAGFADALPFVRPIVAAGETYALVRGFAYPTLGQVDVLILHRFL
ncbi:MAG: hypothetical protein JKP92_01080 [Alphaproteobacteria bacterium]|nr:hypothetical protein [Alphaproteobacteria bacterium]